MSAFTPGPWEPIPKGESSCKTVWCKRHLIAEVASGDWSDNHQAIDRSVAAANANLIAAAPDMYEALKAVLENLYTPISSSSLDRAENMTNAALAKAEGRTP